MFVPLMSCLLATCLGEEPASPSWYVS